MAKIALNNATISDTTAFNHIQYQQFDNGNWLPKTTEAIIKGTVTSTVTNVIINGKAPIIQGNRTIENDTYTLPAGGVYINGAHTNAQGSVTVGNSRSVFINGKSVAIENSNVTTHAGTNCKINGGVSSTVNIGS
ncbi:hypothetical protein [Lysinibacillus macroides]|uniref:Uncharacterized protein n=1 Tax=Lysinibacillus macroides TaxID=33935 RepID=A0A0M9DKZ2_9BACI|nr:hypothetical protein [Lysinibacillus macroides]KOY83019.1 hypothetical protein ADM90_06840 [Lysinibacillus macroides]